MKTRVAVVPTIFIASVFIASIAWDLVPVEEAAIELFPHLGSGHPRDERGQACGK
jgi:hypothetical protein